MTFVDPVEAPTTTIGADITTTTATTETTTDSLIQSDDVPEVIAEALQSQEPDTSLDVEADDGQDEDKTTTVTETETTTDALIQNDDVPEVVAEALQSQEPDLGLDVEADVQNEVSDDLSPTTEESQLSSFSSSLSEAVSAVTSTVSSLFDNEPTEDFSEIENSSANLDTPSVVIANIEDSLNDSDSGNGEDKIDNESSPSVSLGSVQKPQNEVFDITDESLDTTTVSATTEGEIEFDDPSSYDYSYDESSGDTEGSTTETSDSSDITVPDSEEPESKPEDNTTVASTEDLDEDQESESPNVIDEETSGDIKDQAEGSGNEEETDRVTTTESIEESNQVIANQAEAEGSTEVEGTDIVTTESLEESNKVITETEKTQAETTVTTESNESSTTDASVQTIEEVTEAVSSVSGEAQQLVDEVNSNNSIETESSTEPNEETTIPADFDEVTVTSCADAVCQPPEGFENCSPLPVPEGSCCPVQYDCGSTTEEAVTITIPTEGSSTVVSTEAGQTTAAVASTEVTSELTTDQLTEVTSTESLEVSCEDVSCQPPEGYEDCAPLAVPAGSCCPEQYECTSASTEGPVTMIVSTVRGDTEQETDTTPAPQSVTETASSITTDITTDATDSVMELINDQASCTDQNGNTFNHLDDVPSSDPCKLCQCTNGVVVCAQEECSLPEPFYDSCKPLPVEPGQCCPRYECELPDTDTTTQAPDNLEDIQFDDFSGDYEASGDTAETEASGDTAEEHVDITTAAGNINITTDVPETSTETEGSSESRPEPEDILEEEKEVEDITENAVTISQDIINNEEIASSTDSTEDNIGLESVTEIFVEADEEPTTEVSEDIAEIVTEQKPLSEMENNAVEPVTDFAVENNNVDEITTEQIVSYEESTTEKEDTFEADLGLALGSEEGDLTIVGDKFDETSIEVESVTITTGELTTAVDPNVNKTAGSLSTDQSLMCLLLGMDNCNHTTSQEQDTTTTVPILNTGECFYNDKIYQDFDDVPSTNPCNLCYCSFGEVICAERECLAPAGYEFCSPLPAVEGECCPSQWECNTDSTTGAPITTIIVTSPGPVGPEGVVTTVLPSDLVTAGPPAPPQGCVQAGQVYGHNTSVPVTEACDMFCVCNDGDIQCDRTPCHPAPENLNCSEVYVEGECCPSFECTGDDLPRPDSGSHTIDETVTEQVNTLGSGQASLGSGQASLGSGQASIGSVGAELDISQSSEEINAITNRIDTFDPTTTESGIYFDDYDGGNAGDGIFTNCEVNGTVYGNLEDVPSSNPCKLCQCLSGDVICAEQECFLPQGCRALPLVEGECCPGYDCSVPEEEEEVLETTPATAGCGPCSPPDGYEFCEPLPKAPEECCPSQYECGTTESPLTTIIVTMSTVGQETTTPLSTEQAGSETTAAPQSVEISESVTTTASELEEPVKETTTASQSTEESVKETTTASLASGEITTASMEETSQEFTSEEAQETSTASLSLEEADETATTPSQSSVEAGQESTTAAFAEEETSTSSIAEASGSEQPSHSLGQASLGSEVTTAVSNMEDIVAELSGSGEEETTLGSVDSENISEEIEMETEITSAEEATEEVQTVDGITTEEPEQEVDTTTSSVAGVTQGDSDLVNSTPTESLEIDTQTESQEAGSGTEEGSAEEESEEAEVVTETQNEIKDAEDTTVSEVLATEETTTSMAEKVENTEISTTSDIEVTATGSQLTTDTETSTATPESTSEGSSDLDVDETDSLESGSGADEDGSAEIENEENEQTEENFTDEVTTTSYVEATTGNSESEEGPSVEQATEVNSLESSTDQEELGSGNTELTTESEEELELTSTTEKTDSQTSESIGATTEKSDDAETTERIESVSAEKNEATTESISSGTATSGEAESSSTDSEMSETTTTEKIATTTTSESASENVEQTFTTEGSSEESSTENGNKVETTSVAESQESSTEEKIDTTKKPSRDFCIHKGMIIQNLADVPSKDPCNLCQCVEGDIVCATQECLPPPRPDCAVIQEDGVCCPSYDCEATTTEATEDLVKTTQNSAEIQDDDVDDDYVEDEAVPLELESTNEDVDTDALDLSTTEKVKEPSTTVATLTSPKPVSTTQLTSLLTTTLNEEGIQTTVTASPLIGDDYQPDEDYPYVDIDSIGPGACLFENKIYVSAQQIPRDNPCDFCFCFRGDIICLQQSCPPPIPGCTEEIISGFCCPRYECPVKMGIHNVTKHIQHKENLPSLASWFPWGSEESAEVTDETYNEEVNGCEVQGEFYEVGSIVSASSGPCLQCR